MPDSRIRPFRSDIARARLEAALANGFPSWEAAIRGTAELPAAEAGARLGRGAAAIRSERRRLLPGYRPAERRRVAAAARMGAPSWEAAVEAVAGLGLREAARRLGVSVSTVSTWRSVLRGGAARGPVGEAAVCARGFASRVQAVEATGGEPVRVAARRLGVAPSTVSRWRSRERGGPAAMVRLREEKAALARAAGFSSWEAAIEETRGLTGRQAAQRLGVTPAVVYAARRRAGHTAEGRRS